MHRRMAPVVALALISAGCGQPAGSHLSGAQIPAAFWRNVDRLVRKTGFPRAPGAAENCEIPAGGVHLAGNDLIPGRCTTYLRAPSAADLRLIPSSARAKAAWTVVLYQAWAPHGSATFTYVISRGGSVLGEKVSGQPPQFWK